MGTVKRPFSLLGPGLKRGVLSISEIFFFPKKSQGTSLSQGKHEYSKKKDVISVSFRVILNFFRLLFVNFKEIAPSQTR